MNNIVILGAGGMGTLFAARLLRGGNKNVYLINHNPDYVESVNRRGILFRDSGGDTPIPARAFRSAGELAGEMDGPADLVILFVKSISNREAVESARCITGPDTYFLTLQNGLGNPESIAETGVVSPDHILFGKTTEGGTLVGPGIVFHKAEGHNSTTVFMPFSGPVTEEIAAIAALLRDCGIRAECSRDAELAIWEKVMMNCVGSSLAALLRMSTKSALSCESGLAIARAVTAEVVAVAQKKGVPLTPEMAEDVIRRLSGNDLQASMGKDVLSLKQTEIGTLNGAISKFGKELGIPTPANDLLYQMVCTLQSNYEKTWDLGGAPAVCLH